MAPRITPDAVIIAGPQTTLDETMPQDYLNQLADMDYPVCYKNVNLDPRAIS